MSDLSKHPMQEPKPEAPDMCADISDFHEKFMGLGEHRTVKPMELPDELALFRVGFMVEELSEYAVASGFTAIARQLNELHEHIKANNRWLTKRNESGHNFENQFDSLVDLIYVALGTAYLQGFDFDEGWRRVHGANMKKVLAKSADESKRGYRFDVIKPRGWKPADLSDLLE